MLTNMGFKEAWCVCVGGEGVFSAVLGRYLYLKLTVLGADKERGRDSSALSLSNTL